MDTPQIKRCLQEVKRRRKDLRQVPASELLIDYDDPACKLGEGGFCTAYKALFKGEIVCARVVDEDRENNKELTAIGEIATVGNLPEIAVKIMACTSTQKPGQTTKHLAVICELCEHGNLEDFMRKERECLSPSVKLDCFLQVLDGLEQLKQRRVVWRDLKAKNILVRTVKRDSKNRVVKVTIAFTDWGTAVELPKLGKRRMTLQGPGTEGYIAPETRGNAYDYQVDMWAFLVWAASMCLTVECLVDCRLEEKLGELQLEKKSHATSAQEKKIVEILNTFDFEVERGCAPIFNFLKETKWVNPAERWSCDEAIECLVQFRDDNVHLQLPSDACTPAKRFNYDEDDDDDENSDDDEEEEDEDFENDENEAPGTEIRGTLVKPTYAQRRFDTTNIVAMNINSVSRTPYNPMSEKYTPVSRKKSATFASDPQSCGDNVYSTAKKLPPTTNQPLRSILKSGGSNNNSNSRSANGSAYGNYSYASPVRCDDAARSPMVVYSATPGFHRRPMNSRRTGEVVLPPPLFAEAEREAELYNAKMLREEQDGGGEEEEEEDDDDCEDGDEEIENTQPLHMLDKENTLDAASSKQRGVFAAPPPKFIGRNALKSSNKHSADVAAARSRRDVKPPKIFSPPIMKEKSGTKRKEMTTTNESNVPKRGRGRPSKKPATTAVPVDNSMALVLKTFGCSKCRWSTRGCSKCDPDTPRMPRGISAAAAKKTHTTTKKSVLAQKSLKVNKEETTRRPRGRPPSKKNAEVVQKKALALKKTEATKKDSIRSTTKKTSSPSTGCSKCRYRPNGCGACDPLRPRQKRGPRKSTDGLVLCLPAPGDDSGKEVKTFERRKNPVGRPTKHTREIRTELGCSKCRYTACSKCRSELAFDRALFGTPAKLR